jgi:hypothetical protein
MLRPRHLFVQPIRISLRAEIRLTIFAADAGIAQLVERQLPKLKVAGSNPVARSKTGRGAPCASKRPEIF